MKIPSYEQHVAYGRIHVNANTVAKPIKEQDGAEQLQRGLLAQLMTGAGKEILSIENVKKNGQSSVIPSSAKGNKTEMFYAGFSSPQRQQLYQFGKQEIIDALQRTDKTEDTKTIEALDDFFVKQIVQKRDDISLQQPDTNLLVQDYAVLRREMNHLQQQHRAAEKKEAFAQGTAQFVRTAGLIRTPGALEQYVQDNLAAAEAEWTEDDPQNNWPRQKQNLYGQAITHNIEAALQAGEVQQAEQMYDYFKTRLPQSVQTVLQTKVNSSKAVDIAEHLAPRIYEQCVSEEGDILTEEVGKQVHRYYPSLPQREEQIGQALQAKLFAQTKQHLQKESQQYLSLLNLENKHDASSEIKQLLANWQGSETKVKQAEKLALALQQPSKQSTQPAVFNDLQYGIYYGKTDGKKIDEAFESGKLSASDALRLKSRCCQSRAEITPTTDKVLFRSVYRICQQAGLDPYATEEAVYSVFSAGESKQEHLQAAQELKKWLML